ncbi:MAG TPA: histidine--tRNA ligase [Kofleriaceae bacterium]
MPVQPRTTQGVLELTPANQIEFQRMLDTIRRGFERFGFLPIETPTFELVDVLLTKTGGETEKQVYFVQSTGSIEKGDKPELALRFDLTVPLARYVAEHEHELNFPFRRYQIQRVYRGERAQKGRFREFYQCDIDVIGKDMLSIGYDSEIPAVIYGVFDELAFGKFTIFVNNRKLLRGLLESMQIDDQENVLHEIDRLRKAGREKVEALVAAIIGAEKTKRLLDMLTSDWKVATEQLAAIDNATLREGIDELRRVYANTIALGVPPESIKVDLSIVRGLDYYTGTVYETFLDEHPEYGSICSGGRYDNLAGLYTKSKLPGVGISIGATRLFSQMLEAEKAAAKASGKPLTPRKHATAHVIVMNVEAALAHDYAQLASELRTADLNVEVYGNDDKLGKQFKYADASGVPLSILIGTQEHAAGTAKIKDLRITEFKTKSDNETIVPRGELVARVLAMLDRR